MVADYAPRLPPVAAIRAAIEREQSMRALAGGLPLDLDHDPIVTRALLERLRGPRDGARRPWTVGVAMIGAPGAPWLGVGNVVQRRSSTGLCTVWRKVHAEANCEKFYWKDEVVDAQRLVRAIVYGLVQDAYP
jgi:hypothetical protein